MTTDLTIEPLRRYMNVVITHTESGDPVTRKELVLCTLGGAIMFGAVGVLFSLS